jgi:hypothetical protein
VLGSAEFGSDLMISRGQQLGGEVHRSNMMLLFNLIDWCTEDSDLLEIRSAGSMARTLRPVGELEKLVIEALDAFLMLLGLLALALLPRLARSRARSLLEEVSP